MGLSSLSCFGIGEFKRVFSQPETGTDLHAIAEGCISVTPLHLDLTAAREKQRLESELESSMARLNRSRHTRPIGLKKKKAASGRSRRAES